jgi:hypothetical protein
MLKMAVQRRLLRWLSLAGLFISSTASNSASDIVPSGVGENFVVFPGNTGSLTTTRLHLFFFFSFFFHSFKLF